jgi:hypothetical protein
MADAVEMTIDGTLLADVGERATATRHRPALPGSRDLSGCADVPNRPAESTIAVLQA